MFFKVKDEIKEIQPEEISPDELTVGIVSSEELVMIGPGFGFDPDTIEASQRANPFFRTAVEVRENYIFSELRIVNMSGDDDYISVFLKKNLLLVVDILDVDGSTRNSFLAALKKRAGGATCLEKIVCCFVEDLLSSGNRIAESFQTEMAKIEESIVDGTAGKDMNKTLLNIKKRILKYYGFYSQFLDISETLEENYNGIFDDDKLIYISNLSQKITRSKDDISWVSNSADHLQDAYSAMLDQKLNNTMKIFTLITTIFFPLTIIVGWYGMNFKYMPELEWRYGYLFVIALSIINVVVLYIIGKKKKWF